MTLSAGKKLGLYEILAPIGAGGGEVYKARDSAWTAPSPLKREFHRELRLAGIANAKSEETVEVE